MQSLTTKRSRLHLTVTWLVLIGLTLGGLLGQPNLEISGIPLEIGPARPAAALASSGTDSPWLAFEALQRRAIGPLDVSWDPRTGIPEFLTGLSPATPLPYTPTEVERGNPVAIARGFLDENRALFRLQGVASDLDAGLVEPDEQLGFHHVRLRQLYAGLPVVGREIIVHVDPHERIVAVNGQLAPGLDLPTQATVDVQQAHDLALDDLLQAQLDDDERQSVRTNVLGDKTRLVIYVDRQGKGTLAWEITILTESPLGQWRSYVNARRPVVVHAYDSIANAKRRRTYTANNTDSIPGRLVIQEGEKSNDPIAQAAHDNAGRVYDYYFNTFKRDAFDGRGSPMVSTVHFGSDPADAENAAWVSEAAQMIYGDGGRIFRPLAYGLDVVAHEFTHGVIDSTSSLIYEAQSGALNESYADVFGALISGDDWRIGEDVVLSPPYPLPYLRSLEDPNAQGSYDPNNPLRGVGQPAHMREYANLPISRKADNGGVHINSGIPNRAAFLVAQALGRQKMEQIYYRTLTQYLTPDSDFLDAARASIQAATELYGGTDAEAVRSAFRQVGIDPTTGSGAEPTPPSPDPPPGSSPGPTTPQSPDLPEGCVNLIRNGGFENDTDWQQYSTAHTEIIDPELPYSGVRSAWLGGTDKEPLQYIFQTVAIPANAKTVSLSYFRLIHRETRGLAGLFAQEALFDVLIADSNGNIIGAVEELSSDQGDDTWYGVRGQISQFAGKTINLVFRSQNPPGNASSFFVDDVVIAACTTGSGPVTPPTGSADLVYLQGTVTNADTGRGIQGAQLFVLKPGLTATKAAEDDRVTADEVLTRGISDASGVYRTEAPVPRGQRYSAIVVAAGYRSIVADNAITVAADATNPVTVNAKMQQSR